MAHLWSKFNLKGNSVGWIAKSFIVISEIHFLCSHWMSTRKLFIENSSWKSVLEMNIYLEQPPRQAPRLILSPIMSCRGPTIWIDLELCWRIFAILFSNRFFDIIIGTIWHGDRQLPFLRFRRINGLSFLAFGETLKKSNFLSCDIKTLPGQSKTFLDHCRLIKSSIRIEQDFADYLLDCLLCDYWQ